MEQYKEKLRINTIIISIAAIILLLFTLLGFASEAGLVELTPVTGDDHWQSMWRGIVSGASCGVLLVMIYGLGQSVKALKDKKALKKLYIKDNDERQIQIWTSARAVAMQTFLILGLVAGIVAGYFNVTVCITIIACVTIQALTGAAFVFYYSKKF